MRDHQARTRSRAATRTRLLELKGRTAARHLRRRPKPRPRPQLQAQPPTCSWIDRGGSLDLKSLICLLIAPPNRRQSPPISWASSPANAHAQSEAKDLNKCAICVLLGPAKGHDGGGPEECVSALCGPQITGCLFSNLLSLSVSLWYNLCSRWRRAQRYSLLTSFGRRFGARAQISPRKRAHARAVICEKWKTHKVNKINDAHD